MQCLLLLVIFWLLKYFIFKKCAHRHFFLALLIILLGLMIALYKVVVSWPTHTKHTDFAVSYRHYLYTRIMSLKYLHQKHLMYLGIWSRLESLDHVYYLIVFFIQLQCSFVDHSRYPICRLPCTQSQWDEMDIEFFFYRFIPTFFFTRYLWNIPIYYILIVKSVSINGFRIEAKFVAEEADIRICLNKYWF